MAINLAVYRLTLDENGVDDASDFETLRAAEAAFAKAIKRKSVFSARLTLYRSTGKNEELAYWERG